MNESEAIAACEQEARKRWRRLGPLRTVHLIDQDSPVAESHPRGRELIGHWLVVFGGPRGYRDAYFYVDNSNGRVAWQNAPPPYWLSLLAFPVAKILELELRVTSAWEYHRLPRCPHCGGKLRTRIAQQCRWCHAKWHNAAMP